MGRSGIDPTIAAAESRLDRLDDRADARPDDDGPTEIDLGALEHDESMHIEVAGDGQLTDEEAAALDPFAGPDGDLTDCIDAIAEAFNARDLDGLMELVRDDCETPGLGGDADGFALAMEDLWERRPSSLLTRGAIGNDALGVLWEMAEQDGWWRVATVHISDVEDGQVGVIEFSDDPALLDQVETGTPDMEFEQGSRWEEWSEGVVEDR